MSTVLSSSTTAEARPEPASPSDSTPPPTPLTTVETQAWGRWLADHLDPGWRAAEWDGGTWMFTGDPDSPNTAVVGCRTHACPALLRGFVVRFCQACGEDLAELLALGGSGLSEQEFAATHTPAGRHSSPGGVRETCTVTGTAVEGGVASGGVASGGAVAGCGRPRHSRGLCLSHHTSWRTYQRRAAAHADTDRADSVRPLLDAPQWASRFATPYPAPAACLVTACLGQASGRRGLCDYHGRLWWRAGKRGDTRPARKWASGQIPYLAGHQFCLLPLPDLLRREVLFALQRRDEPGRTLDPSGVRAAVTELARIRPSTLLVESFEFPADPAALATRWGLNKNVVGELDHLRWAVGLGHDEFRGIRPTDKTVLDLRAVDLAPTHPGGRRRRVPGTADLSVLTQPWLRRLIQGWVEFSRPPARTFNQTLRAARFASGALADRPGGGQDPTALRFPDMSAVVWALWSQTRPDGTGYAPNTAGNWHAVWFKLLDFGTRAGLLDELAASFLQDRRAHPHPHRRNGRDDTDEAGKAIPESVIAQLDTHLDALGTGGVYGQRNPDVTPADLRALYRTAYILLRDTGRRPNEIATLARDCLEVDRGQTSLIWDNHKSGRLRRRLPIAADTAQAVRAWQDRLAPLGSRLRSRLGPTPTGRGGRFLFPALTRDCPHPHLPSTAISTAVRIWADGLPELLSEDFDLTGARVPFDRSRVYPYAFRHSYAQRHADAGTPTDVLRELMDHRSIETTAGYYTVSMKRRRQAVTALAAQVLDRHGAPAATNAEAYQLRSVAVPYGGCTEPSNIKAGGRACPIRFQCAGCGYYRPDPSYLHAIEQHTTALRADRETAQAMDAAGFVITAMTEEINAYDAIAATMRRRLAELPADERAEIEHAATVLRKIRAGTTTGTTTLALTVINHDHPSASGDHR